jgi:hypothetical protein
LGHRTGIIHVVAGERVILVGGDKLEHNRPASAKDL